ncbi:unnamed protein product [Larinioides sclopetarius]|uniref:Uncharacterized protein n=1 Tax=Larinioides sclopetarius TaxID=280406 RepID=A0AAV2BHM3_9ARAC
MLMDIMLFVVFLYNLPFSLFLFYCTVFLPRTKFCLDCFLLEQTKEVPGIILQSTTSFAEKCADLSEDEIKKLMIDHIKCLMPELPDPAFVKAFHWTYSMLTEPYVDTPGCVVIHDYPCLISGGDSYTESSFNGCITSAVIIVEELLKKVKFLKGHHHGRRRSS